MVGEEETSELQAELQKFVANEISSNCKTRPNSVGSRASKNKIGKNHEKNIKKSCGR